jgi:hypothetical protein
MIFSSVSSVAKFVSFTRQNRKKADNSAVFASVLIACLGVRALLAVEKSRKMPKKP